MTRGGKREGAGRPKLKPAERLSAELQVYCTAAELVAYERKAKAADLSASAWARKRLNAAR